MHVSCPQCGGPGDVTWSGVVSSGDGSVSQVVVRCPDLHWSVRPSGEVAAIVDPWSLLAAQATSPRRARLRRAA